MPKKSAPCQGCGASRSETCWQCGTPAERNQFIVRVQGTDVRTGDVIVRYFCTRCYRENVAGESLGDIQAGESEQGDEHSILSKIG